MSLILGLKEENEMIWETGFWSKEKREFDREEGWRGMRNTKGWQRLLRGRVKGDGGNQRNKESDGGETLSLCKDILRPLVFLLLQTKGYGSQLAEREVDKGGR
jgi:hypothetical protein